MKFEKWKTCFLSSFVAVWSVTALSAASSASNSGFRKNIKVEGKVEVCGLYSTANRLDSTVFTCNRSGGRAHFSFKVKDATACAASERGLPERTLESFDRVEVFLSPKADMSQAYCCIEIGLSGDVLDYRAEYYRKMDYAYTLKTLKVHTRRSEDMQTVEFSVSEQELAESGIKSDDFYLGVFRADFAPGGRLVDWFSAVPHGAGEPDFHRPSHLFHVHIACVK